MALGDCRQVGGAGMTQQSKQKDSRPETPRAGGSSRVVARGGGQELCTFKL